MRYRHNGILAVPQPITGKVCEYVQQYLAAVLLNDARRIGLRRTDHWDWLEPILRRDAGDVQITHGEVTFPSTEIDGLPPQYPLKRLQAAARQRMPTFRVRVGVITQDYAESEEPMASWSPLSAQLVLNLSLPPLIELRSNNRAFVLTPWSPNSKVLYRRYQLARKRVCDAVEHEMRHFLQTLFVYMRSPHATPGQLMAEERRRKDSGGGLFTLPPQEREFLDEARKFVAQYRGVDPSTLPKSIRERVEKNKQVAYILDPLEFFPWIGNMQAEILEHPLVLASADGTIPAKVMEEWYYPGYTEDGIGLMSIGGGKVHMARLRELAPTAYRRAVRELSAWSESHNAAIRERQGVVLVTPQRLLANVLARLDASDPLVAAYARLNRDRFERIAQEYLR